MTQARAFRLIGCVLTLAISAWAQQTEKRREALEGLKALLASAPTTTHGMSRVPGMPGIFTKFDLKILNSDSCQVKYVNNTFSLGELDPTSVETMSFVTAAVDGEPTVYQTVFHTTNYRPSITDEMSPKSNTFIGRVTTHELSEQITKSLKAAVLICGGKPSDDPLPDTLVNVDLEAESRTAGVAHYAVKNIEPQGPYHLCKEVNRDVRLEGVAQFERRTISRAAKAAWIEYSLETEPDKVFSITSRAAVHIEILEVVDPVRAKCPAYEAAFPDDEQDGPSNGWTKAHLYGEMNSNSNSVPNHNIVEVHAPEDGMTYCTHKLVVETSTGDSGYDLAYWDSRRIEVDLWVKSKTFKEGPHIGVTLYARWITASQNRAAFGCTSPPPENWTRYHRIRQNKLADGAIQFENY